MVAIADDLVALHSSDPVTVYLSAALRMRTPSLDAVNRALYDDRSLVRHHGVRRTLWVATPEVIRLQHAAAVRKYLGPERRRTLALLVANGVDEPEAWMERAQQSALAMLHVHGPLSTRRLGQLVPELKHPLVLAPGKSYSTTASAHTRVLLELGFDGVLVRTRPAGTWIGSEYTWAAADTWVDGGIESQLSEREAAAELASRWLRRFGPGTTADLQWWAGWTGALTRKALEDCGAVEVQLEDGSGWVAPGDEGPVEQPGAWAALLPGLDPTVMGWKERGWYLPETCTAVFDRNGNAGPTIWVDGRVVGAWAQAKDRSIRTSYLVDVPAKSRTLVDAEAQRLAALVGDTRFTARFPSPAYKALLD